MSDEFFDETSRVRTGETPATETSSFASLRATDDLDLELVEEPTARLTVEFGADGRLRAPAHAARELLRDRLRRAEVLRTGPGWGVVRSLDPPPVYRPSETKEEVIAAGTLGPRGISLIDFIGFLASGRETGVLTVSTGDVERSAYFHQGDVVWASSTDASDRLGEFLIRRGKITREQLQMAMRDDEKRIGRACVERGFIAPHDLWVFVQAQLTEIFDRMLATEWGVWSLAATSSEALAESQIHFSTQGLLVDAIRRLDEMKVYRKRIQSADAVLKRAAEKSLEPRSGGTLDEGAIEDGAENLLHHVVDAISIRELMRRSGKGEYEVTRLAWQLLRAGLVELAQARQPGAVPKKPTGLSRTEASEVVGVYSMAMREMFGEAREIGRAEEILSALTGFLRDPEKECPRILEQVTVRSDGTLDEHALVAALEAMPGVTSQAVSDALSELLFFVLFQTTEFLGQRRGDDLARRVKMIQGMLGPTALDKDS